MCFSLQADIEKALDSVCKDLGSMKDVVSQFTLACVLYTVIGSSRLSPSLDFFFFTSLNSRYKMHFI